MSEINERVYIELKQMALEFVNISQNMLVVAFPGVGLTYFSKELLKQLPELKSRQIIADKSPDEIDTILVTADPEEKFLILLSKPELLERNNQSQYYFANHVYKVAYLKPDITDTSLIFKRLGVSCGRTQKATIEEWSGGIGQLIKYLALNQDLLTLSIQDAAKDEKLQMVFRGMIETISLCSKEMMEKLGIIKDGKIIPKILGEMYRGVNKYRLEIFPDLTLSEDSNINTNQLTVEEKEILESALKNQGVVTREDISKIKWKGAEYDKFSDQAINKQINRLNNKLEKHQLTAIRGVGYKLEVRV